MIRPLMTSCVVFALTLTIACGKGDDKGEPTPAEPEPSAGAPEVTPEPEAKPVEPEPEEPALEKKKLDELDTFAWMDILKAAGWTDASSGGMAMGAWKQTTIKAKQGDKEVQVTLVAPSGEKEDPKASVKAQPPKEQLKQWQEKGAAELLRDDYLLAVTIEGDPEGAKQLLEHIKEWIIVE